MRRFAISLAVLTCVLFAVPIHAQSKMQPNPLQTGNDMLAAFHQCDFVMSASLDMARRDVAFRDCEFLMGYIRGVSDAATATGIISIPDGVTYSQTSDVVRRFLEANPETRQNPAVYLTNAALQNAWPAEKTK